MLLTGPGIATRLCVTKSRKDSGGGFMSLAPESIPFRLSRVLHFFCASRMRQACARTRGRWHATSCPLSAAEQATCAPLWTRMPACYGTPSPNARRSAWETSPSGCQGIPCPHPETPFKPHCASLLRDRRAPMDFAGRQQGREGAFCAQARVPCGLGPPGPSAAFYAIRRALGQKCSCGPTSESMGLRPQNLRLF